ncbi:MAG: hypothetical protein HQK51_21720 [Oligoflexia bacterium]|nr:hypothetical protein [Oligoflexia bacterium]
MTVISNKLNMKGMIVRVSLSNNEMAKNISPTLTLEKIQKELKNKTKK